MAHFIIGLRRDSAAASTLDAFKSPPFDALVPVPTRFVLRYSSRVFRWRPNPSKREIVIGTYRAPPFFIPPQSQACVPLSNRHHSPFFHNIERTFFFFLLSFFLFIFLSRDHPYDLSALIYFFIYIFYVEIQESWIKVYIFRLHVNERNSFQINFEQLTFRFVVR